MATALPRPPNPIPPSVPRYDTTGRPERVQVEYERRVHQFLEDVDNVITEGLPPAPPPVPSPLTPQPVFNFTAGTLLTPQHAGAYLRFNFPVLLTIGLDSDANVPGFAIGTLIEIEQTGPGVVQIGYNGPAGVVLLTARTGAPQTSGQYTRMFLRKVDTDTWLLY